MRSTQRQVAKALSSDDITSVDARVIKEWADAFDAMEISQEFMELKVNRDMQLEINSFVASVSDPSPIKNLLNRWQPHTVNVDEEGISFMIDEVRRVVNSVKWFDSHDDGVDEATRRENYKNRERFEDATIAYLAIKFSELWAGSESSVVVINSMMELGLFEFGSLGFSKTLRYGASKLDGMIGDIYADCADNFYSCPPSALKFAAKQEVLGWSKHSTVKCGSQVNASERPSPQWLVDGVIPKTVEVDNPYVGFLYGNSSTYKSFIATGICSALVKGNRNAAGFAGLARVDGEPVKVMYLSGEDSYGIRLRFEAELGKTLPNNVSMNLEEIGSIFKDDGGINVDLMKSIVSHDPDLIVMDTMNSLKLCESNNSSSAVSRMMHQLKGLGTTVMVIHHSTKGGDSMEGSHAMFSNADFVLRTDVVEREDDIPVVDLSCGKLKNAAKFKTMRIELVDQGESLVCRNHKAYEESREDEAKALGLDSTLLRLIVESDKTGITVPQLANHSDVNWQYSRQHLIGTLDKNIYDMVEGWAGVVKVSSPGVATRYILGAKYKAKL